MNKKDEQEIPNLLNGKYHMDKPWDVIEDNPEMTWKVLKNLHSENEALKAENSDLRNIIELADAQNSCKVSK